MLRQSPPLAERLSPPEQDLRPPAEELIYMPGALFSVNPVTARGMRDFPTYCERFFLEGSAQGTAAELFLPLK